MDRDNGSPADIDENACALPATELVEGVHYYLAGGHLVFTEAYHRLRGYCCGSRCRHCPFDYANVR